MKFAQAHPELSADLRRVPKAFITKHSGLTFRTIQNWLDGTTKAPTPPAILAAGKAVALWKKERGNG